MMCMDWYLPHRHLLIARTSIHKMSNMLSLKLPCLTIVFKTMEGFSIIAKPTMTFLLSFLPQVRLMAKAIILVGR